jgi:hypothetical protein
MVESGTGTEAGNRIRLELTRDAVRVRFAATSMSRPVESRGGVRDF